ncbi:hypothetical protein Taro_000230 [Colocasia esculenta]|uniref:Uncharacterized protein n=1 Tax=Colocasia esculenta TaxID=4460 RepID=A0A843T790_COLES|nr:hypothetical protein [Colocasia esculenta]
MRGVRRLPLETWRAPSAETARCPVLGCLGDYGLEQEPFDLLGFGIWIAVTGAGYKVAGEREDDNFCGESQHPSLPGVPTSCPAHILVGFPAKRDGSSELPVRYTAWRCSQGDKTQKFAPLGGHEKKGSSLFGSGVSGGGRAACSSRSVSGRSPVRNSGDGSVYEVSSFGAEPEYDVVSNDIQEVLDFEDSTASEVMYPMECEFIEESNQSFNESQTVSEKTLSKRDTPSFSKMKEDAENTAITSLATRSFTTVDLGKKLRGKKYPPDVIESVIAELKGRSEGISILPRATLQPAVVVFGASSWVILALLQKGVSEADINKATNLVFMDGDTSSGPQAMYLGMSKVSMDRSSLSLSSEFDKQIRFDQVS